MALKSVGFKFEILTGFFAFKRVLIAPVWCSCTCCQLVEALRMFIGIFAEHSWCHCPLRSLLKNWDRVCTIFPFVWIQINPFLGNNACNFSQFSGRLFFI